MRLIQIQKRAVHYYSRSKLLIPNYGSESKHYQDDGSKSVSSAIMEKNGFFTDSGKTGLVTQLMLGKRVLNKLTSLIRQEMNHLDGQEIEMPSLSDLNLWKLTGRAEILKAELFTLKDRKGVELCLCPTHEEVVTSLVAKLSKILPHSTLNEHNALKLYQITRKYRDESRPKHGLLRTREFLMKDLYTFHLNDECANRTYEAVCKAYERILDRLDLDFVKATASVGAMGGKRSDEFHIVSSVGEDKVYTCGSCRKSISADLVAGAAQESQVSQEMVCAAVKCAQKLANGAKLEPKRCIEVGHAFILGDRYTKHFPVETNLKSNGVIMACFGIGVSRLLQACVEQHQLENRFPNWPLEIAPFRIGIVPAKEGSKEEEKSKNLVKYFSEMLDPHYTDDIVVDDRTKLSIGSRLIDMKLLGVPYVITLGKHIHDEQAEIVINSTKIREAIKKDVVHCHTREVAVILKQISNDYFYMKKQKKVFNYFEN